MSTIRTLPQPKLPPGIPRTTSTFEMAGQIIVSGPQDTTVQATQPLTGTRRGQVVVRIGRVLIYLTDREALESFVSALREAETLAEQAFGPVMPPPTYRPRGTSRKVR